MVPRKSGKSLGLGVARAIPCIAVMLVLDTSIHVFGSRKT
jgi:hypothetical protein